MKLLGRHPQSGVALLVVLVLIVLLLAYSIVAQTAVLSSRSVARVNRNALTRLQQRAAILETIQAGKIVPSTNDYRIAVDQPLSGPVARSMTMIEGDVVVTIDWLNPPVTIDKYLVNAQRRRVGAARISSTARVAAATTQTQTGAAAP